MNSILLEVTRRSTVQPLVLSHTTPTTQTAPPMQHTAAGYSFNSLHIPSNVPRLPSSDSIDSRGFQPVNGQSYNKTLVVRIPRVQLQPQEKKQEQKALNELQQDHHEPVPAPPITSLIVRIPLKHVRLPWDYVPPPVSVSPPVPSELIVSVQLSEHVYLHRSHSSPSPLPSSTLDHTAADVPHPVKHVQTIPPVFIDPIPSEPYPRMQSPVRLKRYSNIVPDDSVIGIDGVVGSDNYWHGWAECIPGESLTVLPYVYIDGLSGYNEDQIWSSLDRQELTDCLQQHMSWWEVSIAWWLVFFFWCYVFFFVCFSIYYLIPRIKFQMSTKHFTNYSIIDYRSHLSKPGL